MLTLAKNYDKALEEEEKMTPGKGPLCVTSFMNVPFLLVHWDLKSYHSKFGKKLEYSRHSVTGPWDTKNIQLPDFF